MVALQHTPFLFSRCADVVDLFRYSSCAGVLRVVLDVFICSAKFLRSRFLTDEDSRCKQRNIQPLTEGPPKQRISKLVNPQLKLKAPELRFKKRSEGGSKDGTTGMARI